MNLKLTSRIKQIISILLDQQNYITVNVIADHVQVSSRTILRELDFVEKWLQDKGIGLEKKKGMGIKLILNDIQSIAHIHQWLLDEETEIIYSPNQRHTILKAELLKQSEPTKLYALTHLLDVTESTISNDLEQLTIWFAKYDIALIRKPGFGVLLEGDEEALRRSMIALLYEHFHEANLIDFIINSKEQESLPMSLPKSRIDDILLSLMDITYIPVIKKFIHDIEEKLGYQLADNSYIALVIRLIVIIKRIKKGFYIEIENTLGLHLKKEKIYIMIKQWIEENGDEALKKLREDEILSLTMHIKGAKLRESLVDNGISMIEDYKMIKLAKKIIRIAEMGTGTYLEDNEKLLIGLVRHLGPAINRVKLKLDIMNPLLEDIKNAYPQLFKIASECVTVIEQDEKILVPEDEVAYIAIHIGAAIKQKVRTQTIKYRVVVACANGIGTSQLLVSEIEKAFPNVTIVNIISTLEMDREEIQQYSADFIISTVPTKDIGIPSIYVNPILTEEDKIRIEKLLNSFSAKNYQRPPSKPLFLRDKLVLMNQYNNTIIEVLDNFRLIDKVEINDISQLIHFVSKQIGTTDEARLGLEKAFVEREEKGSTILGKKGMMLLHCRTPVADKIYFMVIRGTNVIEVIDHMGKKNSLDAIAVMVAPLDAKAVSLEILSEISRSIITTEFSDILKKSIREEIYSKLSEVLNAFIQTKVIADEC